MPPLQIRLATPSDIPAYHDFLLRHGKESGQDGDLIFAPYETAWNSPLEELTTAKTKKWTSPVTESGWERCWILTDGAAIHGELTLTHAIGLKTSLHRALLMMGIERSHRANGHGSRLMQAALDWTREQPSLDWIQLNVFDHNKPAKSLYRKFGFEEVGTHRDLFRVHGKSIDDTEMSLKLKR